MCLSKMQGFIATVLLILSLSGCGLTAPHNNEGYADLDSLNWRDVDSTMTLSIGPTLLRIATRAVDDDPQTQALLQQLDGVRVKVYEINGDATRVAADMDRMSMALRQRNWEPVILVTEEDERTYMLLKSNADGVVGLTLLTSDTHEAVVINVMGDLNPELFSETMAALEVSSPAINMAP